ncbi:MAG: hypothetical protein K0S16_686 [Moraxellaceae bacterium]|jgi:hypothetical protein|nr:hypothetical protein [Moraxellaceae bacterium]
MNHVQLTEDQVRFIQGRVSIVAASRDVRRVPSVARAAGCRVAAGREAITLLLPTLQCQQLLADIATTRTLAVVFTEPSTHRTQQFKGSDAQETPLEAGDRDLAAAHNLGFAEAIMPLGYSRELALGVHDVPDGRLTAVTFHVDAVFEQTPGPKAGVKVSQ